MKKRVMALAMAGIMSLGILVGCGEEAAAPAAAGSEPAATEAPAEAGTEGELTFADLQTNYATLVEVYNQVEELYMNDGIAQDDTIESLLTEAKGIIEEMGEATEDSFPDAESKETMNNAMAEMIGALGNIVDGMEVAEGGENQAVENADAEEDLVYDGGYYANDGDSDFVVAFFTAADGSEFAYVNDGNAEACAEYEVSDAALEDGTEFVCVSVGGLDLGYFEAEDGLVYLVDLSDGNIFAAAELSEEEAAALIAAVAE